MQLFSVIVFAIFAVPLARCVPALDASTLANNAKQAQQLNAQFATLKATDPCQGQETACVGGAIATCVNGKFDTSNGVCVQGQRCFAIPNVRSQGTSLLCTSESNVVALMNAAGVTGGVTGLDNSSTLSRLSSTSSTTTGNPSAVTVTVTVTANSASTVTTTTVSPNDASSILSQFLSSGQPVPIATSSSSVPALTPAANPDSVPAASNSNSGTPATVVSLTAAGDSTNPTPSPTTSSGNVIQLTAAPGAAGPSSSTATPSPSAPVGGGGGGGYGY